MSRLKWRVLLAMNVRVVVEAVALDEEAGDLVVEVQGLAQGRKRGIKAVQSPMRTVAVQSPMRGGESEHAPFPARTKGLHAQYAR